MTTADPFLHRLTDATDERLMELSQRRVTRHTRRILEELAELRGVAIYPVDRDGFPIPGALARIPVSAPRTPVEAQEFYIEQLRDMQKVLRTEELKMQLRMGPPSDYIGEAWDRVILARVALRCALLDDE